MFSKLVWSSPCCKRLRWGIFYSHSNLKYGQTNIQRRYSCLNVRLNDKNCSDKQPSYIVLQAKLLFSPLLSVYVKCGPFVGRPVTLRGWGGAKVFHWKSSDNPGLPQQLCGDAYSWNFILKSSFSLMFFNLVWAGEHFFKNLSHISIAFRKHNLILISFWCYKQFNMQVTKTGDFIKMMTAFGFTVQWSSL